MIFLFTSPLAGEVEAYLLRERGIQKSASLVRKMLNLFNHPSPEVGTPRPLPQGER